MEALILMHIESEGPGTLGAFLREAGVEVTTLRLHRGDRLPSRPETAGLIVSLGGPMNVYEDEKHPFLGKETEFLRRAIARGAPVLGICLGAQLIARACGAKVYRAPVKEVGWSTVRVTEEGRGDEVCGSLPEEMPVLQWHEDTFDLPEGGLLLAASPECPHQAFRVGNAYGLQFHIEVEGEMLADWFADFDGRDEIVREHGRLKEDFDETARRFYEKLVAMAGSVVF